MSENAAGRPRREQQRGAEVPGDGIAGPAETGADDFYAELVHGYLTEVCGPEAATSLSRRVMGDLARAHDLGTNGTGAAAEAIHDAVRRAALDSVALTVPRLGRPRCRMIPCLLGERARGTMSASDLRLYNHLSGCPSCVELVTRFDGAEWTLRRSLAGAGKAGAAGGRGRDEDERGPTRRRPAVEPGPEPAADGAGRRFAHAPPRGSWPRRAAPLIALAVVAALAAVLGGAFTGSTARTPRPAAHASGAPANGAQVRVLRTPFTAGGARWAVFSNPQQPWTTALGKIAPGRGRRWQSVEILVRNLSRPHFDPRVLHVRLEDAAGVLYFPDPHIGTAPNAHRPPRPVAFGGAAQAHLAFRVALGANGLRLLFDPLPTPGRFVIKL